MYLKWIFRAWPFLVTAFVIVVHQYSSTLPSYFPSLSLNTQVIDKYLSFSLNIIGGLLVIYSIDSNLGLFKKGSLHTLFFKWVKSFPLAKGDSLTIVAEPSKYTFTSTPANVELTRSPESIEELYSYTQKQISLLREDLTLERNSRKEAIGKMSNEWSTKHSAINKNVIEINDQLKTFAIGGIKLQILGVLLVTYGSYIGLSV